MPFTKYSRMFFGPKCLIINCGELVTTMKEVKTWRIACNCSMGSSPKELDKILDILLKMNSFSEKIPSLKMSQSASIHKVTPGKHWMSKLNWERIIISWKMFSWAGEDEEELVVVGGEEERECLTIIARDRALCRRMRFIERRRGAEKRGKRTIAIAKRA